MVDLWLEQYSCESMCSACLRLDKMLESTQFIPAGGLNSVFSRMGPTCKTLGWRMKIWQQYLYKLCYHCIKFLLILRVFIPTAFLRYWEVPLLQFYRQGILRQRWDFFSQLLRQAPGSLSTTKCAFHLPECIFSCLSTAESLAMSELPSIYDRTGIQTLVFRIPD